MKEPERYIADVLLRVLAYGIGIGVGLTGIVGAIVWLVWRLT